MKNTPKKRRSLWLTPTLTIAVMLLFMLIHSSYGQTITTTTQTLIGDLHMIDVTTLFAANDPVMTDPGGSDPSTTDPPPPHLSNGTHWALFGFASDAFDPQNSFNQVISFDTTNTNPPSNDVAGAFRKFGPGVKIEQLTDQVALKYFLHNRTCGNGSPRIQLGIDTDGDGKFDRNAFGPIGDKPFGGGCLVDQWVYEDMTDNVMKWDLSQFGCGMTNNWTMMEACLNTFFPNYQVVNAVLVDDGVPSGNVTGAGCAYFDQVTAGKDTLDEWDDTSGGSQANTCSPR